MDEDVSLVRDVGCREYRGTARDNRHGGIVIVARQEIYIWYLLGEHQFSELGVQCD